MLCIDFGSTKTRFAYKNLKIVEDTTVPFNLIFKEKYNEFDDLFKNIKRDWVDCEKNKIAVIKYFKHLKNKHDINCSSIRASYPTYFTMKQKLEYKGILSLVFNVDEDNIELLTEAYALLHGSKLYNNDYDILAADIGGFTTDIFTYRNKELNVQADIIGGELVTEEIAEVLFKNNFTTTKDLIIAKSLKEAYFKKGKYDSILILEDIILSNAKDRLISFDELFQLIENSFLKVYQKIVEQINNMRKEDDLIYLFGGIAEIPKFQEIAKKQWPLGQFTNDTFILVDGMLNKDTNFLQTEVLPHDLFMKIKILDSSISSIKSKIDRIKENKGIDKADKFDKTNKINKFRYIKIGKKGQVFPIKYKSKMVVTKEKVKKIKFVALNNIIEIPLITKQGTMYTGDITESYYDLKIENMKGSAGNELNVEIIIDKDNIKFSIEKDKYTEKFEKIELEKIEKIEKEAKEIYKKELEKRKQKIFEKINNIQFKDISLQESQLFELIKNSLKYSFLRGSEQFYDKDSLIPFPTLNENDYHIMTIDNKEDFFNFLNNKTFKKDEFDISMFELNKNKFTLFNKNIIKFLIQKIHNKGYKFTYTDLEKRYFKLITKISATEDQQLILLKEQTAIFYQNILENNKKH